MQQTAELCNTIFSASFFSNQPQTGILLFCAALWGSVGYCVDIKDIMTYTHEHTSICIHISDILDLDTCWLLRKTYPMLCV